MTLMKECLVIALPGCVFTGQNLIVILIVIVPGYHLLFKVDRRDSFHFGTPSQSFLFRYSLTVLLFVTLPGLIVIVALTGSTFD